jgi:2-isopropylmalate synthase
LIELGYELEDEALNRAFAQFKDLADKKKEVTDEDLLAVIEEKLQDAPEVFKLESIFVTYGDESIPTAKVRIATLDGDTVEQKAEGNGSVDAIYNAIDQVSGEEVTLSDYSIKSVTHGKDALGEVHVVLTQNEISVQGRGVSTDILGASARAYVDGLNKLIEKRKTYTNRVNVNL